MTKLGEYHHLFFKQVFNGASQNPGDAVESLGACFVDIFVPLLIHLNGTERYTRAFSEFLLRATVGDTNPLQIGILKVFPDSCIHDPDNFCYVCFMECVIHILQILEGEDSEDITEAS